MVEQDDFLLSCSLYFVNVYVALIKCGYYKRFLNAVGIYRQFDLRN